MTDSERLLAGTFMGDEGVLITTSGWGEKRLVMPGLQSAVVMLDSIAGATVQVAPESELVERAGCSGLRRIASSCPPAGHGRDDHRLRPLAEHHSFLESKLGSPEILSAPSQSAFLNCRSRARV